MQGWQEWYAYYVLQKYYIQNVIGTRGEKARRQVGVPFAEIHECSWTGLSIIANNFSKHPHCILYCHQSASSMTIMPCFSGSMKNNEVDYMWSLKIRYSVTVFLMQSVSRYVVLNLLAWDDESLTVIISRSASIAFGCVTRNAVGLRQGPPTWNPWEPGSLKGPHKHISSPCECSRNGSPLMESCKFLRML